VTIKEIQHPASERGWLRRSRVQGLRTTPGIAGGNRR